MNSNERDLRHKYRYNELSYILDVYLEFELRANHTNKEFEGLKTGECRFSYNSWCRRLAITKKKMEKAIKKLSSEDKVIKQIEKGKKGSESKYFLTRYMEKNLDGNFEYNKRIINIDAARAKETQGGEAEKKEDKDLGHSSNIYNNLNIESNNIYIDILNHWNSKEIIVHRNLTSEIKSAIDKSLKLKVEGNLITPNDIKKAIDNYKEVLEGNNYYNYKWTLVGFLSRRQKDTSINQFVLFMDNGPTYLNYKQSLQPLVQESIGIAEKKSNLQGNCSRETLENYKDRSNQIKKAGEGINDNVGKYINSSEKEYNFDFGYGD